MKGSLAIAVYAAATSEISCVNRARLPITHSPTLRLFISSTERSPIGRQLGDVMQRTCNIRDPRRVLIHVVQYAPFHAHRSSIVHASAVELGQSDIL